jgi:hypothetical protein
VAPLIPLLSLPDTTIEVTQLKPQIGHFTPQMRVLPIQVVDRLTILIEPINVL